MDCSCAPILQFFSVASDGATTERQIYNRVFFVNFVSISGRIATPIMDRFGRCFRHLFTGPDALCYALNISQIRL